MGAFRYRNGFKVTLQHDIVDLPLRWKRPRIIFVNSMSDLFHKYIPDDFVKRVFATMEKAHWHTFQILTKRSKRVAEMADELPWPKNIWMGVSVETPDYTFRISHLVQVPAAVRFISLEPLLAPVPRISLRGIDWVIVGGESGPADGIRVGSAHKKAMSNPRSPILFQTVGWYKQKKEGSNPRW